jgi:hypothetical protein
MNSTDYQVHLLQERVHDLETRMLQLEDRVVFNPPVAVQDEAWKSEQKALAQEAIDCATEALRDPDHPATIAVREYYGATTSATKPTLRVRGWVWKDERCDGLYVPSYTPAQPFAENQLLALVDPQDLHQPLENTDWFTQ